MTPHTPTAFHNRVVTRRGADDSPATLIYLDTAAEPGVWSRLTAYLHHRFNGQFTQITYRQQHLTQADGIPGTFFPELDMLLDSASGARLLVAHTHNASAALTWVGRSSQRAKMLTALVLFAPALEAVAVPAGDELHLLRTIPTWIVTDRTADAGQRRATAKFVEVLWADHEAISSRGDRFPLTDPARAAEPILAALRVARDVQLREGA
ncbi:hypothetical protein [Nocardia fusca]|uniref:hypothetical protein n=1 Tax=Nocardia fusca TaxID=941183 RepID=UPI0007A752FB|nr:hypothetical protein [Nocardia fusca]